MPLFQDMPGKAKRLIAQTKETPHKLYSLHAEEVECIAKGKAHKKIAIARAFIDKGYKKHGI